MSNKLTLHKLTPTKRSSHGPYFGGKRRERQKRRSIKKKRTVKKA